MKAITVFSRVGILAALVFLLVGCPKQEPVPTQIPLEQLQVFKVIKALQINDAQMFRMFLEPGSEASRQYENQAEYDRLHTTFSEAANSIYRWDLAENNTFRDTKTDVTVLDRNTDKRVSKTNTIIEVLLYATKETKDPTVFARVAVMGTEEIYRKYSRVNTGNGTVDTYSDVVHTPSTWTITKITLVSK